MPDPKLPLTGVTVLDLTRLPPGAFCTVLLADLGADVIRVESPKGRMFDGPIGLNRGKRSVAVDLRHPRGLEVLRLLAAHADVLVENERPGALDERGFGYSHASKELPKLIWCSISGYGQDGPYAQWSGHDLSFAAHSGLLTGLSPELPWHPQLILPIPIGALMAGVGILAALRERDQTGAGCQLDISLSESATWLLSSADGTFDRGGRGVPIGPDRRLYACAGGTWVAVTAAEPRTWGALCDGLGLPDLKGSLHRWDDPDGVTRRLAAVFLTRPAEDWVAELGPQGASVVRVNRGPDLTSDPHATARGVLQQVGDLLVPRTPIRIRDEDGPRPPAETYPPPPAGAHTRAVLEEAGLAPALIDELEESGAVGPDS
ncbi:CaiB/BaiF CoA transferase family protein [Pseudofrankia inefficax]|uniref:L-carnitine dehydratase/bile acid-inducible protein F n=1 Tax=Pseudofrankia inefficax (strain DSM 45817 / CECT 9037 / DDB 130130 / EuI1c) TaxID=298654 RepID=E3J897_PSEI1|nr:CaiB/BaiF CoA-transferase family protein [Pseudofrankia inefficax]ADP83290.1 L-carnitine dehydratase/bile acid-inducible protein F [Pseudofrankia inefficax]